MAIEKDSRLQGFVKLSFYVSIILASFSTVGWAFVLCFEFAGFISPLGYGHLLFLSLMVIGVVFAVITDNINNKFENEIPSSVFKSIPLSHQLPH